MSTPSISDKHFMGKPCRHGHSGLRYLSNKRCVECQLVAIRRHKQSLSPEEFKRQNAHSQSTNLAKVWRYKAAKANRVPKWADLTKIKEFYANCPAGMVVDHIIPLRGELVSGLHVHNNLQYLTGPENAAKANKFEIE
jgi:hypothetical protein